MVFIVRVIDPQLKRDVARSCSVYHEGSVNQRTIGATRPKSFLWPTISLYDLKRLGNG